MPRIDDQILNSVFYLYPSVEAAEAGEEEGGTGFRISIASRIHNDRAHLYAVSNVHVVNAPGYSPVIRWNSTSHKVARMGFGKQVIVPLACNQWTPHPDGDDLAIAPLGSVVGPQYGEKFYKTPHSIPSFMLLTRDAMDAFDIGFGDDVYLVGRFIHHAGKRFNQPSVRSGVISLMPDQIELEPGVFQEAFLVEMRSISGHSGSPVMWKLHYSVADLLAIWNQTEETKGLLDRIVRPEAGPLPVGPWLIGVDCADFKYYNPVYQVRSLRGQEIREKTDFEAKSHAGLSVVIPAWKIQEILDLEEFVIARQEEDDHISQAKTTRIKSRTQGLCIPAGSTLPPVVFTPNVEPLTLVDTTCHRPNTCKKPPS